MTIYTIRQNVVVYMPDVTTRNVIGDLMGTTVTVLQ